MGQIEINHTGSGGGVVLSSDGTNLLLGGSAVGGGADLYAANESSPTAQPSATGANAIAIGEAATASGQDSIAIGDNSVSSATGSVGLGRLGKASGDTSLAGPTTRAMGWNAVALGISNHTSYGATADFSFAQGYQATASGSFSVAFGSQTISSGSYSIALGQLANATATNSIAIGHYSSSAIIGKKAYASGRFAAVGDAQGSTFILRSDTTDATAEAMTTNNSTAAATNQVVAATDTCIMFSGTIVAMQNGAQDQGGWEIKGLLKNDGGTTTLVNSNIQTFSEGNSWAVALSADNTNNALKVQVTGEASHNIRWVANIQTSEVTYA